MDLHVWVSQAPTDVKSMTGPQGKVKADGEDDSNYNPEPREPLPGSPFTVHVSEGNASATGSFVKDAEAKQASQGSANGFTAGEHIVIRPQVRDPFGNASTAPEGALTAWHEVPGSKDMVELEAPKMRGGIGSYELGLEPIRAGTHVVHIKLHGEEISGSPVSFKVTPGVPSVQKCYLTKPEKQAVEKVPIPIVATLVDKYGNRLDRGGVRVDAKALGAAATSTVEDRKDGTYMISITAGAPGEVKLTVRIDSVELTPTLVVNVIRGGSGDEAEGPPAVPPAEADALEELGEVSAPAATTPVDVADAEAEEKPAAEGESA